MHTRLQAFDTKPLWRARLSRRLFNIKKSSQYPEKQLPCQIPGADPQSNGILSASAQRRPVLHAPPCLIAREPLPIRIAPFIIVTSACMGCAILSPKRSLSIRPLPRCSIAVARTDRLPRSVTRPGIPLNKRNGWSQIRGYRTITH